MGCLGCPFGASGVPLGRLWLTFGCHLGDFWFSLGSHWPPLGSFWPASGDFGRLWGCFGTLSRSLGATFTFFVVLLYVCLCCLLFFKLFYVFVCVFLLRRAWSRSRRKARPKTTKDAKHGLQSYASLLEFLTSVRSNAPT